ncbi:hypothetical protein [Aestuariispira ectoiniformans]|uniref:hypothetical protein n=1 Tax=Aestuariispira ectoiniformans TaxID=2775080 RepID=UPI00223BD2F8|nr:hypothetical protein [Aestuariispira ectoiniformans]
MDEVDYNAEIAILLNELQGDQGDMHEVHMRLQQLISTMRAEGLPVPDDLRQLESQLDKAFTVKPGQ